MKTKTIIGLTNKEPGEISQLGPAAHALTERFPLQLQVKWDKYNFNMFQKLFQKVYPNTDPNIRITLAELIDKAHSNGHFVSPRTAIHALQTIILNQDDGPKAFKCLEFIPGLEDAAENIEQDIEDQRKREEAKTLISELDLEVDILNEEYNEAKTNNQCLQVMVDCKNLDIKAQEMTLPDELHNKRKDYRDRIQDIMTAASDKALKLTKPASKKSKSSKEEETTEEN